MRPVAHAMPADATAGTPPAQWFVTPRRQFEARKAMAWDELTTALGEHHVVDGGHFLLREHPAVVAAIMQNWLGRSFE